MGKPINAWILCMCLYILDLYMRYSSLLGNGHVAATAYTSHTYTHIHCSSTTVMNTQMGIRIDVNTQIEIETDADTQIAIINSAPSRLSPNCADVVAITHAAYVEIEKHS